MHFTGSEMKTMAWLLKSEIRVQDMIPDHDEDLYKELTELYESFTW